MKQKNMLLQNYYKDNFFVHQKQNNYIGDDQIKLIPKKDNQKYEKKIIKNKIKKQCNVDILKKVECIKQNEIFKYQDQIDDIFEQQIAENMFASFLNDFLKQGLMKFIDRDDKLKMIQSLKTLKGDEKLIKLKHQIEKKIEYT